jgi:hypothetical protein
MYYLKEMIGEEKVNIALRAFLDKFKYKGAPYPTSLDAIDEFDKQTPDSLKYIVSAPPSTSFPIELIFCNFAARACAVVISFLIGYL